MVCGAALLEKRWLLREWAQVHEWLASTMGRLA
jgi:hypothetical protein